MPNYVTNIIEIRAKGKMLNEILTAIRRDGDEIGSFDFQKLVPMPESLNLTEGSITDKSISAFISHLHDEIICHPDRPGRAEEIKRYADASKQYLGDKFICKELEYMPPTAISAQAELHNMSVESFLELGKKYLDNQLEHGATTWYKWCTKNWGTKWDLSEGSKLQDTNKLVFETAWSAPFPIMEVLSKRFPMVQFSHKWADEDLGNNVGQIIFLNGGELYKDIPKPGSKKAYEMAFAITGINPVEVNMRYDPKAGTYVYDESMDDFDKVAPAELPAANPPIDNVIDGAKSKALLGSGQLQDPPGREDPER